MKSVVATTVEVKGGVSFALCGQTHTVIWFALHPDLKQF
jgi:hypothetical protein